MATFGFSVGDFLAALQLVGTIIDGLRASGHSGIRFRSLLSELYTLEDALIRVKRLDIVDDDDDESQASERIALQQAAALCQRSMYDFYKKIEKYQPHLTMRAAGGGKNWLKDGWMKIKWATCRTEDVEMFQAELRGHRGSIEILLLTLSLNRSSIQAKTQEQRQRSLAGKIQDLSSEWMGKLANLSSNVASCMEQGKQLVESTAQILRTNIQLFQHIREIQNFITRIPGQVERQQPVYLIDALGKASPFHLEFVRSAEAFTAILKVNFKDTGIGPQMIERGEFVIQETGSQLEIDLTKPWEMCFSPGQRVAMSMVFRSSIFQSGNFCPRCDTLAQGSLDVEIECKTCGMVFCRIEDLSTGMAPPIAPLHHEQRVISYVKSKAKNGSSPQVQPQPQKSLLGKRKREDYLDGDIRNFRRVQIKRAAKSWTRCKLHELQGNDWVDLGTGSCHCLYSIDQPSLEFELEEPQKGTAAVLYTFKFDARAHGFQRQQG
ncbi:hypothetical protein TCE0_042f14416 [Talaromyces pinophilus]|uniref:Uncharacterized protein n=1 Tax=Talaromyces pinophilus TaxID=128442 RepID=A0A6V8HKD3_TALPI|nr:hypothetical protein TCE0_042f14416 [Talaromyces pinophilus]